MSQKSDDRKFNEAMYRGLTRLSGAVERTNDLLAAEATRKRQEAAERGPYDPRPERIGNVADLERPRALSMLMSIPGFAQEATRIPHVATASGAAGVTPEGQVICSCGGGVTDLELGSMAECVGGCGRFFTGTADKAFSFGPWPETCDCGGPMHGEEAA